MKRQVFTRQVTTPGGGRPRAARVRCILLYPPIKVFSILRYSLSVRIYNVYGFLRDCAGALVFSIDHENASI